MKDVVDIRKATKAHVSSKAYVAGLLGHIEDDNEDLLQALQRIIVPQGLFHAQRESNFKAYNALVSKFHSCVGAEADQVADESQAFIISKCSASQETITAIQKQISQHGSTVIARSGANVEDLEEPSGAGLHDKIAAVRWRTGNLQHAILSTWASIWTRRAASSRRTYKVVDNHVSLSVLIQPIVHADLSFVVFSHEAIVA